jgi:hypothetical protein
MLLGDDEGMARRDRKTVTNHIEGLILMANALRFEGTKGAGGLWIHVFAIVPYIDSKSIPDGRMI